MYIVQTTATDAHIIKQANSLYSLHDKKAEVGGGR